MIPAEFADLTGAGLDLRAWAVAHCRTMDDAWTTARSDWLVWIATRPSVLDDRTLRKFAVWCARHVQHLMTDPRSLSALDVAERHADGQATDEELESARIAAGSVSEAATWAVALAAAWAAALAAAWAAAWYSAEVSAEVALSRAAQAAWLRENATPDWERVRKMGGAR